MNLGYIILCPDNDPDQLKRTIQRIKSSCGERESVVVLGSNCGPAQLERFRSIIPDCQQAGRTLTGMANLGMKSIKSEWAMIIFSGAYLSRHLERRVSMFARNAHDILFPVINRQWGFVEGSFNGVVVNREFFGKVGDFPEIEKYSYNDFELSKLLWAQDALKTKAQFKAIVGMGIW